jgi:hypothetical protein
MIELAVASLQRSTCHRVEDPYHLDIPEAGHRNLAWTFCIDRRRIVVSSLCRSTDSTSLRFSRKDESRGKNKIRMREEKEWAILTVIKFSILPQFYVTPT